MKNEKAEHLFSERLVEWANNQASDCDAFGGLSDLAESCCQSPIEELMLVELYFADWGYTDWRGVGLHDGTMPFDLPADAIVNLAPQYPCGNYSIDIAVLARPWRGGQPLKIAVECDGHDFHEKTHEQAAHDKRRDRELQKSGFLVFRFTGAEITKNAKKVANEVAEYVSNWIWDQGSKRQAAGG